MRRFRGALAVLLAVVMTALAGVTAFAAGTAAVSIIQPAGGSVLSAAVKDGAAVADGGTVEQGKTLVISLSGVDARYYRFVALRCNGAALQAGYANGVYTGEYVVPTSATSVKISATVVANTCSVTVVQPENGVITVTYGGGDQTTTLSDGVNNDVPTGTQLTITATPDTGYALTGIKAGSTTVGTASPALYTPLGDTTLTAAFVSTAGAGDGTVTVTYTTSSDSYWGRYGGGSILVLDENGNPVVSGGKVRAGSVVTVRTEADEGYTFTGISIKGGLTDLLSGGTYKVSDRATSVSFTANFTRDRSSSSSSDGDETRTDAAKPYVIISSYTYGGQSLTAGETCSLTLTFYNTSKTLAVENMKVTMDMPEALMLTSSSNSFYVDTLGAGKSISKTVQVTAKADAKPASHEIAITFDYDYVDNKVRKTGNTSEHISIPVVQVDRFEVTGSDVPEQVMVGEEGSITVNFVNKGRSDVYNISAEIAGNLQTPGQQQNLGNLASGTSGSVDFSLVPLEGGVMAGEITITYEDTNMKEKTITVPYSVTAMEAVSPVGPTEPTDPSSDPGTTDDGSTQGKIPWWAWAAVCAVIALLAGLVIRRKVKAKRSEQEDEDI